MTRGKTRTELQYTVMKQEQLESLLRELLEKHVSLDNAAKILWQARLYIEYRDDETYCTEREEYHDNNELCHTRTERARLQLEHYFVVNNIQSIKIEDI